MELSGLQLLRAAHALLIQCAGAARSRVHDAAQTVWSAFFYRDDWPTALQARAQELEPVLFKYGTIRMTLAKMSDAEIADLQQALIEFVQAAEEAAR